MSGNARAAAVLALYLAGCGQGGTSPTKASLPADVAAIVGSERIRSDTIVRIAAAQRLSRRAARERAITDALFAASARADAAQSFRVSSAERSVLARALLERLRDAARVSGPPTDEEVQSFTEARWPELDRPPSVRTTHVVVLVKKPQEDGAARARALELAAVVRGAKDARDFLARVEAEPKGDLEVRAESLPPVTADGRLWDPSERPPKPIEGTFDADFTRAAFGLSEPGDQSGVVKSAFGYHVIRLDERIPELRVSLAERRERLADDVYSRRAKLDLDALVTKLRASTPVAAERASDALTALVTP
jgi:hypothetical protein